MDLKMLSDIDLVQLVQIDVAIVNKGRESATEAKKELDKHLDNLIAVNRSQPKMKSNVASLEEGLWKSSKAP